MKMSSFITKTLVSLTLGFGIVSGMSAANAASIVPQLEGEVETTNLTPGCVDATKCIDTTSYGYKVTSLDFDGTGGYGQSRLFVDKKGTNNTYSGAGLSIQFGANDIGTNSHVDEYWFRPVAILENGTLPENGELEVGLFEFNFDNILSEITLSFLDVEDIATKILEVNGAAYNYQLPAGANNAVQTVTLKDVKSFKVHLGNGNSSRFTTGDGVLLQGNVSVPEPTAVLGLGTLAVAGVVGLRQRKKTSQAV
ncbi:LEVG family PEP-CTERM protein [Calothrix sp. 336/3]|uniref:LEVG family PEP-CTERM protein n=1 Tax=Calothrix sp. 336/3 TaxID=1337936 RepID=UPI0004E37D19|nr:LEVG family PEP-CTERM protein [Calothrix sp. 336/3]AKG22887.1 exosortase [Calothrix sp. 336/3]